jgi:2-keto-4-pentenoate hydratase
MQNDSVSAAADLLWRHWSAATRLPSLPPPLQPSTRAEGYAIQHALAVRSGQPVVGWKIAATSVDGQRHIGVDGPLAGRLLRDRLLANGARLSLDGNTMRVAEAEFAFRFARALPARQRPYAVDEVLDAVDSLQPAIEVPDSRYEDFLQVGTPQLIADDACAWWLVVGDAAPVEWRALDLSAHRVEAFLDGAHAASGSGERVLGDPRVALAWVANELRTYADGVRAGDLITTGTCITPVPIAEGVTFAADFGVLGKCSVRL